MVASWTACEWVIRLYPCHIIASLVGCPSVTIPSHRLVCGSAEQQNEEQRRLRLERGSEGRAPRRRRRRERWQEEWRRSSGIACALVKVLCGCRCHRGSVTIHPSPYQTYRQKGGELVVELCVGGWCGATISSPRVRQRRAAGRVATAAERRSEKGRGGRRGGRTVAAAAARAGADAEGREAPGPLAPGVLRFTVRLLDPLDIALFLGVVALLYRYAMAGMDGAVGYMDASLLELVDL